MLRQFAELVNREMFWVVTEVCSEHNPVRRSKIIKQFIKIAREFLAWKIIEEYYIVQEVFNIPLCHQANVRSAKISIPCSQLYLAWATELFQDYGLLGKNCQINIRSYSVIYKS